MAVEVRSAPVPACKTGAEQVIVASLIQFNEHIQMELDARTEGARSQVGTGRIRTCLMPDQAADQALFPPVIFSLNAGAIFAFKRITMCGLARP